MIENGSKLERLPVLGVVTLAARLPECAFVRVGVARGAVLECNVLISDVGFRIVDDFEVALLALDLGMRARQRESRLVMVELGCILPPVGVVTSFAIRGELAPMLIGVAADAFGREPEISAREVLDRDFRRRVHGNPGRLVTGLAGQSGVLPL